jgi:hypothetical protein
MAQSSAHHTFVPDLEISLKAVPAKVSILHGAPTAVWTYQAQLLKGDAASVQTLPESYIGPMIRARKGQKIRVIFQNELPDGQASIVHWHGLRLPEEMDGHPRYAITPGQTYVYEFTVHDRAGTYWFHPHPDMMFKRPFWVALALTIPVVIYSHMIQMLLGYTAPVFPGSEYLSPVLGSIIFWYGGWVFLTGAISEIRSRTPGMMTLVALAITTARIPCPAIASNCVASTTLTPRWRAYHNRFCQRMLRVLLGRRD